MAYAFGNPGGDFLNDSDGLPVTVITPLTGTTYKLLYSCRALLVNPAGTIATLTLWLPKGTQPGATVEIGFQQVVTSLTVHDGFGNAISGAPTAGSISTAIIMVYVNTTIGWVLWK
jgi:hypothetical protein